MSLGFTRIEGSFSFESVGFWFVKSDFGIESTSGWKLDRNHSLCVTFLLSVPSFFCFRLEMFPLVACIVIKYVMDWRRISPDWVKEIHSRVLAWGQDKPVVGRKTNTDDRSQ